MKYIEFVISEDGKEISQPVIININIINEIYMLIKLPMEPPFTQACEDNTSTI